MDFCTLTQFLLLDFSCCSCDRVWLPQKREDANQTVIPWSSAGGLLFFKQEEVKKPAESATEHTAWHAVI